jgi:hypothetical protein
VGVDTVACDVIVVTVVAYTAATVGVDTEACDSILVTVAELPAAGKSTNMLGNR